MGIDFPSWFQLCDGHSIKGLKQFVDFSWSLAFCLALGKVDAFWGRDQFSHLHQRNAFRSFVKGLFPRHWVNLINSPVTISFVVNFSHMWIHWEIGFHRYKTTTTKRHPTKGGEISLVKAPWPSQNENACQTVMGWIILKSDATGLETQHFLQTSRECGADSPTAHLWGAKCYKRQDALHCLILVWVTFGNGDSFSTGPQFNLL